MRLRVNAFAGRMAERIGARFLKHGPPAGRRTARAGRIHLLFEGGSESRRSGVKWAVFNLSWLLNDRELSDLLNERTEPE